jgi:hypothetical protein
MVNLMLANPAAIEKMSRETTPELFPEADAPQLNSTANLWKTARRWLGRQDAQGKPDYWRELMRLLANQVDSDEYLETLLEIYTNGQISPESRTAALNMMSRIFFPVPPEENYRQDTEAELRQLLMLFKEVWNNWPEGRVVAHAANILIGHYSCECKGQTRLL